MEVKNQHVSVTPADVAALLKKKKRKESIAHFLSVSSERFHNFLKALNDEVHFNQLAEAIRLLRAYSEISSIWESVISEMQSARIEFVIEDSIRQLKEIFEIEKWELLEDKKSLSSHSRYLHVRDASGKKFVLRVSDHCSRREPSFDERSFLSQLIPRELSAGGFSRVQYTVSPEALISTVKAKCRNRSASERAAKERERASH